MVLLNYVATAHDPRRRSRHNPRYEQQHGDIVMAESHVVTGLVAKRAESH